MTGEHTTPRGWFVFRERSLLLIEHEGGLRLPHRHEVESFLDAATIDVELKAGDARPARLIDLSADHVPCSPFVARGIRELYAIDEALFMEAGRAIQLLEWRRDHRFCGRCGTPTLPSAEHTALECPSCGLLAFPRIAPAVIVAVEKDGTLLLAQSTRFRGGFFSVLAGFVEPGETLEETVHREIREEVGITVGDVRYFGSQSWPFPHSLMIGFTAKWVSGDIVVELSEIVEAAWYASDALPKIPPRISIARALIDDFLTRTDDHRRGRGGRGV
jgi:NAD+ diphosphatase